MENQILEYEAFVEKAAARPMRELAEYHVEMVKNFQWERLIHLKVTLFFAGLTLAMIGVAVWLSVAFCDVLWALVPLYLACGILVVLEVFYVKHYYFLENHIQKLYKYNKKLRLK